MILTQENVDLINANTASDVTIWGSIVPNAVMRLVKSSFVPSAQLSLADITLADFAGSGDLSVPFGTQVVINDTLTGRKGILIKEPLGGYKWVATAAPSPAQTIYGYVLSHNDDGRLIASALLPAPVTITNIGDFVEVSAVLGFLQINPYDDLPPPE